MLLKLRTNKPAMWFNAIDMEILLCLMGKYSVFAAAIYIKLILNEF